MAKILVIDDSPTVRASARLVLKRAGHDVTEAGDGREGLARFVKDAFDVVIVDMVMPNRGGLETITEIQRRDPNARIIGISAVEGGDMGLLAEAKRQKIDVALVKPFKGPVLLDAVERCLKGSSGSQSEGST